MALLRMDHVGVVVPDLDEATAFFTEIGFRPVGAWHADGDAVGRIIGLRDVRAGVAMLEAPNGGRLELVRFDEPAAVDGGAAAPSHATGLRHVACAVDDLDDTLARLRPRGAELVGTVEEAGGYRLCYLRGPAGIIVELAEKLSQS